MWVIVYPHPYQNMLEDISEAPEKSPLIFAVLNIQQYRKAFSFCFVKSVQEYMNLITDSNMCIATTYFKLVLCKLSWFYDGFMIIFR